MNAELLNQISILKDSYKPAENLKLRVSYYPYKNINHTIRIRQKTIYIKISDKIQNAPADIQLAVTRILFDKLFRIPVDKKIRYEYLTYVDQNILPALPQIKRKANDHYRAEGKFFDLEEVFQIVNHSYFDGKISKPTLGWSLQNSTRRLAFYDHERDLIVVSRIFDSKRTPSAVIEFLMYHEILHILIPVEKKNGRRIIHPRNFRIEEEKFNEYEKVQKWLKKRMWKLRF